jgi:AcrR family transcriptional regulator
MLEAKQKPVKRQRRSPEERRQQILQAAVGLFARQGFARTTTKEIAREAQIAEGTIYLYFPNKQDLLFSFLESKALQSLQSFFAIAPKGDEVIRDFLVNRFTLVEQGAGLMKVVFGEALFDPKLARVLRRRLLEPARRLLTEFIAEGIREGRYRQLDPEIAGKTLAGLFFSFGLFWPALLGEKDSTYSKAELADILAGIFLDGVRRRPEKKTGGRQKGRGSKKGIEE